jgi:tetratricopeptide (TPR) repeat protein
MKYHVRPGKNRQVMKTLLTIALFAISLVTNAQAPEVRAALRLIDIEQPSKGIAELERLAPASSQNQYYLGLAYLRTGNKDNNWNKDKALAAFEKGISMNEKDGLNYAGKGQVKLIEKNGVEAKANFDKALVVSKQKDSNVMRAIGEAYLVDTKFVLDAISILNKAKGMNAADAEIHIILGDAFLMQNNGGESVSSYERAASADKKNAKPNYKVAKVYERSKNTEMVMENLNKAITVDPEYAPAYKELAESYYSSKQAAKAVEASDKYMSITEFKEQAKYAHAFYLIMAKQFDKAAEIFKDVVNAPDPPAIALKYYARALSLSEQDKSAEAITVFDRFFQKAKPEDIQAFDYTAYGKALQKQGTVFAQDKPKKRMLDSLAAESYVKSIDLDSTQTDVLQSLGDIYFAMNKYPEAIKAFTSLTNLRKQPLSQDLWSIGRAYYYNLQFMEADSAFTKLSEKQPNVPHGYLWAAKSRAQIDSTGAKGLAIPMYEKFIEVASQNAEKNKKDIIGAYEYLGSYYVNIKPDGQKAKECYEKILALDPNNATAKQVMDILKKG